MDINVWLGGLVPWGIIVHTTSIMLTITPKLMTGRMDFQSTRPDNKYSLYPSNHSNISRNPSDV